MDLQLVVYDQAGNLLAYQNIKWYQALLATGVNERSVVIHIAVLGLMPNGMVCFCPVDFITPDSAYRSCNGTSHSSTDTTNLYDSHSVRHLQHSVATTVRRRPNDLSAASSKDPPNQPSTTGTQGFPTYVTSGPSLGFAI